VTPRNDAVAQTYALSRTERRYEAGLLSHESVQVDISMPYVSATTLVRMCKRHPEQSKLEAAIAGV
jgi:hypothetical protein